MKRQIITIDEEECNGCGLCIPNCPEGALQLIDGKARLVSDLFCDGLGACIGHCPENAITVEEREAVEYDERMVMKNIVRQGGNVIAAHLEHLRGHGQEQYLKKAIDYLKENNIAVPEAFMKAQARVEAQPEAQSSALRQWPVQIMLVSPTAPSLKNADLLVAADCVPFAYAGFHEDLLRGKVLLVGCPKLDDAEFYREKLTELFKLNDIKSVTVAQMEVPCCFGMMKIVKAAIAAAGKEMPVGSVVISVKGERIS